MEQDLKTSNPRPVMYSRLHVTPPSMGLAWAGVALIGLIGVLAIRTGSTRKTSTAQRVHSRGS